MNTTANARFVISVNLFSLLELELFIHCLESKEMQLSTHNALALLVKIRTASSTHTTGNKAPVFSAFQDFIGASIIQRKAASLTTQEIVPTCTQGLLVDSTAFNVSVDIHREALVQANH